MERNLQVSYSHSETVTHSLHLELVNKYLQKRGEEVHSVGVIQSNPEQVLFHIHAFNINTIQHTVQTLGNSTNESV
jgi:hypothetical protein